MSIWLGRTYFESVQSPLLIDLQINNTMGQIMIFLVATVNKSNYFCYYQMRHQKKEKNCPEQGDYDQQVNGFLFCFCTSQSSPNWHTQKGLKLAQQGKATAPSKKNLGLQLLPVQILPLIPLSKLSPSRHITQVTFVWLQQTVRSSCWSSHRMGISLEPTNKRFNSAYLQS